MQIHKFKDPGELNCLFAQQLQEILVRAVQQRGHAYLVVSGGSTPVGLFKCLAKLHLPWQKVTVCLADERCVDVHDSASNERLVKEHLLQHQAKEAQFLSLIPSETSCEAGLQAIAQRMDLLPEFDAVILGMGEDGHTASLFPCSEELAQGLDDEASSVLLVHPKNAPFKRMSLSKRKLLNSQFIFFHLIGPKKWTVLNEAIAKDDPMLMPVCAFINHPGANVHVMYAP